MHALQLLTVSSACDEVPLPASISISVEAVVDRCWECAHRNCALAGDAPLPAPLFSCTTDAGSIVVDKKCGYGAGAAADWAKSWTVVLGDLLTAMPPDVSQNVASIAFDGTSATALLVDRASGEVLAAPKLYNESQGAEAVAAAKASQPQLHSPLQAFREE